MKIWSACLKLYANHLITVLVFAVMIPLLSAEKSPRFFSAITTYIYIAVAYGTAWETGAKDARKIEGYYPSWDVPVKISVFVSVVPVILFVMYLAFPELWKSDVPFLCGEADFFVKGLRFSNTADCIFRLWYLHFGIFIPNGNVFAYFCAMLILPIIVFSGYGVGLKRFKLKEYLYMKLVFVGNSDKNKK